MDIEIADEIVECAYALCLCCQLDQLLHRLLARRRLCLARRLWDDALGEVVEPLEAAASGDGDEPGVEEMLERGLAGAPAPPVSRARARIRKVGCGKRTALGDFGIGLRHVRAAPRAQVPLGPRGMLFH